MGEPPSSRHTIDRINPDGNYAPDNCRWATITEQARNKRTSHFITYQGESLTIAEWAERLGVDYKALFARLSVYGWSVEKAFSTPFRKLRTKRGKEDSYETNSLRDR
jgi:hypothetical protein